MYLTSEIYSQKANKNKWLILLFSFISQGKKKGIQLSFMYLTSQLYAQKVNKNK